MESLVKLPETDTPSEVAIAETLLPWRKDDNRARYLGYLACGFDADEGLYMIGESRAWLEEQRQDITFSKSELRIPEIRKELAREYIELDFYRNYRLVLQKDYVVLERSLGMDKDENGEVVPMTTYDQQYLLKMRSSYTPQQLQILQQVMSGQGPDSFNWSKWIADNKDVVEISRTDTIRRASG